MADEDVVTSGPNRGGRILRSPGEQAERAGRETEQQRIQRVESEVRDKSAEDMIAEIKDIIQQDRLRAAAQDVKNNFRSAGRGKTARLEGRDDDPNSQKGKAKNVKEEAQRILLASKAGRFENPAGTSETDRTIPSFAEETIKTLSQHINAGDVTEYSGAILYDAMNQLITGQITDFNQLFNVMAPDLPGVVASERYVYEKLRDSLKEVGRREGLGDEVLNPVFQQVETQSTEDEESDFAKMAKRDGFNDVTEYNQYYQDLQRGLRRYIGDEPEDQKWLKALYSVDLFAERLKFVANNVAEHPEQFGLDLARTPRGSEAYWQAVSNSVTNEISYRFGKIYRSIARAHKDKFIDEIANENPMESISTAKSNMLQALQRLADRFNSDEVKSRLASDPELAGMKFYTKNARRFETEEVVEYTTDTGVKSEHRILKDRRIAIAKSEEADASEFLSGVKFQVERFIDHVLPYNHNVQALFLRQAGQDGTFWSQIGQYAASSLSTFDLDSLNYIPDADIVSSAFRMYSKYVKADFARWDWKNEAGRFTEDFSSPNTPVQKDVVKQLQRLFPELQKAENRWRLDQAMNIAIGVSRGVYLTEVTTVAWADAPHTGKGGATFDSYYTNSNAALMGLNPQHSPDRWKTPGTTIGPLLHMPVYGIDRKFMRRWNHIKLYEWMKKRENAYVQGKPAFAISHPKYGHHRRHGHGGHGDGLLSRARRHFGMTERGYYNKRDKRLLTFIDAIPNIGKVGGPIERGGWRNKAYEGWTVVDPETGQEDVVATFKAIENIGFEGALWYADSKGLMKVAHGEHSHGAAFTDEFGQYMYDKYINPVNDDGTRRVDVSYEDYVDRIKHDLKRDKQGEHLYAGVLVSRGLAYMLRQRTPTLMPTIERTRLSETGKRGWQELRETCGWTDGKRGTDKMDRALKNIMLVEQQVRQETSQTMKEYIQSQFQLHPDDPNYRPSLKDVEFQKGKEYQVNEERFVATLKGLMTDEHGNFASTEDQTEYNEALQLFKATQEYLDDDYMEDFAEKIRTNKKPEKFFPFAIAAEELDTSFLTYASAGPDVMRRALGEIGHIESNVVKPLLEGFMGKLRDIATVEHSHDPLIHAIHEAHHQIEQIHGEAYANEIADYMARIATAYFKRDRDARGVLGRMFINPRKPHSLAAEFAGASWKHIWEWDVEEQESFYLELDRRGLLPQKPKDLNIVEDIIPKRFLGIKYGYRRVTLEDDSGDPEHSGAKLRRDMGATRVDMARELLIRYGPLIVAGLLALFIRRAAKEEQESKH